MIGTDDRERPARESKKKELLGFLLLLAGLGALVTLAFSWNSELVVEKVTVEGTSIIPVDTVVRMTGVRAGMPMSKTELWALRERILQNAYIRDAVVQRELPDGLLIEVSERVPVALLQKGELYGIDREGVILPHVVSEKLVDLPVLTGFNGIANTIPGSVIGDSTLREALRVVLVAGALAPAAGQLISEIRLTEDREFVLTTADYGVPVLLGRGDYAGKLAMLVSFWKEIARPERARMLESVDVRFKDQVIVRWQNDPHVNHES